MSRSTGLKCFEGNYDGLRQGLVIASSQKQAAAAAGTSLSGFRDFWHQAGTWPAQDLKPNVLYTKPFDSRRPWVEGRCEVEQKP
jgi:hypothetical protein